MKKIIISIITLALILTSFFLTTDNLNAESNISDDFYNAQEFRNQTFYRIYKASLDSGLEEVPLSSEFRFESTSPKTLNTELNRYLSYVKEDEFIIYNVSVEKEGLYEIGLEYYLDKEFYSNPYIDLLINDETQFNEMSDIKLEVKWKITEREEKDRYNRYGNELLPYSDSYITLYKYYLKNSNNQYSFSYKYHLKAGDNEIKILSKSHDIYFGDLLIYNEPKIDEYQEVEAQNVNALITIEAEDFLYKNDLEVKASYYKEPKVSPFSYKNSILNVLDGDSMSRGGTKVEYEFEVEKEGYYNMAFKYLHSNNIGVPAGKKIEIDGVVPFKELECYTFDSSKKWKNEILGNSDGAFYIYLTEGKHTLTISSSSSYLDEYIDKFNSIMDWINQTSLIIKNITGGSNDSMIDWDLLKYVPTLKEDLLSSADTLEEIYNSLERLDKGSKGAPELSTIKVAIKQLRRLAEKPNKLNSKLNQFSDGSGSCYQLIGAAITSLYNMSISIDRIYFTSGVALPKANANFFVKLWNNIKSFFYSFFDQRYKSHSKEKDVLEVWVQQSSMYLDIIQNMIDDGFTKETGIKVRVSILPSTAKIVLTNSTKDNPDVCLSLDVWEPYAYALRGILEDLSKYDGFLEVTENIYKNNFAPIIYEDGVYGIPETQSAYLLYYRKDVLNFLGLDVPSTWNDVINMLPYLQSYKMNFYHPLGGENSYKAYGITSPLIYQFGGEIYKENGMTSTLTDENTIQAIKFMTDLFTVYNLPQQVSSFFEHFRTGDYPIGISTTDLYLQLGYAAPEISGQWGVSLMPGVEKNGVVERWAPTYGKCSILFSNSKLKEEGWELIKWWNKAETQIDYIKNIKLNLGEKYMIVPANTVALENSVWNEEIKEQILEQVKWSRIPAVTPGSYIVERELSQIWNKIVVNQMNVRIAIDESIPRINRELQRKLEEFGYLKNGKIVKEYKVAINENIMDWFGGNNG